MSRKLPYAGRVRYRPVPLRSDNLHYTAAIRYGSKPYGYRQLYSRSRIRLRLTALTLTWTEPTLTSNLKCGSWNLEFLLINNNQTMEKKLKLRKSKLFVHGTMAGLKFQVLKSWTSLPLQ